MISGLYYLYFFLWRVCRASKDEKYGEFRVHSLLLLVEAMFGMGAMYAVLQEDITEVGFFAWILMLVAAPLALNLYCFLDKRKLAPYLQRFDKLKPAARQAADVSAAIFCLMALALPFVVRRALSLG